MIPRCVLRYSPVIPNEGRDRTVHLGDSSLHSVPFSMPWQNAHWYEAAVPVARIANWERSLHERDGWIRGVLTGFVRYLAMQRWGRAAFQRREVSSDV